ncbi:DNA cytosine methyltransferase [Aeromonas hydrophila]|uniref:DNA cytosine methyltransferase n=1 Tax=Aeromonas hydrophila TaxID=644 RepID=UPI0023792832|nr:DNA cytosine methyltransferase [Aeromonas hydrophila]MDD9228951.1 DNA cytosine methyltransferase [Aeromonas hydrophila]
MRKSQVASICRHTFNLFDEIVVDNFAGGGGASTGIEMALGRSPEIAINHDPDAISMHTVNHPGTEHYCESVWDVDPVKAAAGRPVGLAWFSPDCKHFSKAKGGSPVNKDIRGLAWVTVRWAMKVRPRVMMLENVEEFQTWGPLIRDLNGDLRPCPERRGNTFRAFVAILTTGLSPRDPGFLEACRFLGVEYDIQAKLKMFKGLGYKVEWKELRACDYGTPTIRKRLFMVMRCDGQSICWPKPTHAAPDSAEVKAGKLKPWLTAADIIDWSIPCPSIFERKRPLAENTLRRIAKGLERFVINAPEPFIVPADQCSAFAPFITEHANASHQRNMPANEPLRTICAQVKGGHFALVSPVIARQFGRSVGQSVEEPLGTVMAKADKSQLVTAFLAKHYTGVVGAELTQPLPTVTTVDHNALVTSHLVKLRGTCQHGQPVTDPMPTVTAGGLHIGEVRTFLLKYYGTDSTTPCTEPLHTVTTRDRFGLVTVRGEDYQIVDIGMRMLEPHELFAAQGFPADYVIDHDATGKKFTKTAQVARCGNAVCPPLAAALVRANLPEMCADAQEEAA